MANPDQPIFDKLGPSRPPEDPANLAGWWASGRPFAKRCRAVLEPLHEYAPAWGTRRVQGNAADEHGRCELAPHTADVDHAIVRGPVVLRWHTIPTFRGSKPPGR